MVANPTTADNSKLCIVNYGRKAKTVYTTQKFMSHLTGHVKEMSSELAAVSPEKYGYLNQLVDAKAKFNALPPVKKGQIGEFVLQSMFQDLGVNTHIDRRDPATDLFNGTVPLAQMKIATQTGGSGQFTFTGFKRLTSQPMTVFALLPDGVWTPSNLAAYRPPMLAVVPGAVMDEVVARSTAKGLISLNVPNVYDGYRPGTIGAMIAQYATGVEEATEELRRGI